jgi:hypothetical protein
MAGARTNVALLILILLSGISGLAAFGVGTTAGRWVVIAHGLAGIGVVLLAPWKSSIVRRGLTRRRSGRPLSVVLLIVTLITIASGFVQSTGATSSIGQLTTMQVHVGSAVVAIVLAGLHVKIRPVRWRAVARPGRRAFLRAGGLTLAAGAAYLATEGSMRVLGLSGAQRRFTGSHERGSFNPSAMPTTQWFDDSTQRIDPADFRLRIGGRTYALADLGDPTDTVVATLDCTSGWYSKQVWSGIALRRLLSEVEGGSVMVRSTTGYGRRFPMGDIGHLLLATHVGERPLSPGHGAPVRLVAPGRRGFWWVKWVDEVRVDDRPPWWQSPFPLS